MAKITRSAIEKKILTSANDREMSKEQITDLMIKRWKKQVKKDMILDEYKLHEYFLPKKIRRIKKAEIHRQEK